MLAWSTRTETERRPGNGPLIGGICGMGDIDGVCDAAARIWSSARHIFQHPAIASKAVVARSVTQPNGGLP